MMKNLKFGRLLKGAIASVAVYEGKTAPAVERDLGERIGLTGASIQRYKSGHIPPELRTIEILAEAGVKRGYLNRDWLQQFLVAAYHPAPEKVLNRLCPIAALPSEGRAGHNLPPPTYGQFIMRHEPYDEVIDGLNQRSAVVLIASLGGMGKTSLALEVAKRTMQDDSDAPRFDAAIWISDRDDPGTTHLDTVLDEIARVLDYPGLTSLPHDEKRREVDQLLRRRRNLIIIDNFETITDRALLDWLLRLPEPSKAIVTTREYRKEFRRNCWPIELRGMRDAEAEAYIKQCLRVLKIESRVSDMAQFAPLLVATGGNPKAIAMALGYIKYQNRPLREAIEGLYESRGELFKDLFERAWSLLDEAAKSILLAAVLFPASVSREGLSSVADVQGFAFDSAIERITDLALLDVQRQDMNVAARYHLHPLVRAFAVFKNADNVTFEKNARRRWLQWCGQLAEKVGYCWANLERLELMDLELDTIHAALEWSFQNQLYVENVQIARNSTYFYYVRGFWTKQPSMHLMGAESACRIGDIPSEARFYTFYSHILCKQGNVAEAEKYFPRMRELIQTGQVPDNILQEIQHAFALAHFGRDDLVAARDVWQQSLELSRRVSWQAHAINRQWLAVCLYHLGNKVEARHILTEVRRDAQQNGFVRAISFTQIWLADIDLSEGQLDSAQQLLDNSQALAQQYQDREHLSDILRIYARLYALRGDVPAAKAMFLKAIDLCERLGFRQKLARTREDLARLESAMSA